MGQDENDSGGFVGASSEPERPRTKRLCTSQDKSNIVNLYKTYGELFWVIIPLTLWGAVIASGLSLAIPKIFCKDAISQSQVC